MMNELMQRNQTNALMFSDPAAVAAAEGAKARIQSAYIMAMQRPRSYDQARVRILKACRRPDFAEKVEYSKPVGGKSLVGPSIRFAELALREWGNVFYENQVVYDDDNVRRVRVVIIDLETNTTYGKEIRLTKTVERRNAPDLSVLNGTAAPLQPQRATARKMEETKAPVPEKPLPEEKTHGNLPAEKTPEAPRQTRKTAAKSADDDPPPFFATNNTANGKAHEDVASTNSQIAANRRNTKIWLAAIFLRCDVCRFLALYGSMRGRPNLSANSSSRIHVAGSR